MNRSRQRITAVVVDNDQIINARVRSSEVRIKGEVRDTIVAGNARNYDGPYEITPTEDVQILAIENQRAVRNITIEAIPTNYGRITRYGNSLRIT